MYHAARSELKRLWPQAVLATTATVILPVVAVLALTWLGFALPHILASVLGTLAISIGIASLGASIWNRRKESVDVAFGELMLWRYLRRRRAVGRAEKNVTEVDLGPDRVKNGQKRVIRLEQDGSLEVLHRLTLALEATDPYTMGHSRRVERHVHRTAMAMGLSTLEIRELRIAAALHDVGKICVPDRILRKDAALTPEEMAIVREHVSVGAMMVAGAAPASVTEAILRHHEFWDGHGYPSGLAGENIPLFARVIAIADAWDAITSARPYKGGEARSRAMDVLSRERRFAVRPGTRRGLPQGPSRCLAGGQRTAHLPDTASPDATGLRMDALLGVRRRLARRGSRRYGRGGHHRRRYRPAGVDRTG